MAAASDDPLASGTPLSGLAGEAGAVLSGLLGEGAARGDRLSDDERATLARARDLLARLAGGDGAVAAAEAAPAAAGDARPWLFFDVSDLLGYYPHNRLPTGVQRVQVNTILAILEAPGEWNVGICCFSDRRKTWLEVPIALFRDTCEMSVSGGDASAPGWRAQYERLMTAIDAGRPFVFPRGASLVNLGTSWWVENYFMYLREAKRTSGIRFIPFVHDMIPVLFPNYCIPDLVNEFIDWLVGVVRHADAFLVNSEATRRDLVSHAERLGRGIAADEIAVIPLAATPVAPNRTRNPGLVAKYGLEPSRYVLFVSTIEERKNQSGAFIAWQRLIARHGRDKTPRLVCVGKNGFNSLEIIASLEKMPELKEHVAFLPTVDDTDLDALYDHALFTIYPSFYEGWGLPVTEALCHHKVPLVANNSSLPEAGAGLAMLFETHATASFVEALERLTFDRADRERREEEIRRSYRPRGWREMSGDILSALGRWGGIGNGETVPSIPPGYYPMERGRAFGLDGLTASGEMLRGGVGWWRMEDHGCWSRAGGGELRFRLDGRSSRVALWLHGFPAADAPYTILLDGEIVKTGLLKADHSRWVVVDLPASDPGGEVVLAVHSQTYQPPQDHRVLGVGLRAVFVLDTTMPRSRLDFIETVALHATDDFCLGADQLTLGGR